MTDHIANLSNLAAKTWAPPPDYTCSEWADAHRHLSSESSAEAGRWRTSRTPYLREPMDCVTNIKYHTVVWMFGAQLGKTESLNCVIGYHIDHDPCPMLAIQPTIEMAQVFSKDRIAPMLRDSPTLAQKVSYGLRTKSDNTILHKEFPGGRLNIAGANSPASLASRPVRIALLDEVDRFPASAGKEGDPVALAKARTKTFWNRKLLLTSTPTLKGSSRIEMAYEESDMRQYWVPCPHCDEMQLIEWRKIKYDSPEEVHKAYMVCDNGCVIEHKDKYKMLAKGEWRAQRPDVRGVAGFHLSSLYSPFQTWGEIAQEHRDCKGVPERLKAWVNLSLAETWEEEGDTLSNEEELLARREPYDHTTPPDDILLITAAVDVQDDRLVARAQGWGLDMERWNLDRVELHGDPGQGEVWQQLDDWIKEVYHFSGGRTLKKEIVCIDSGGHHTQDVYNFTRGKQGRRIFAVKGSNQYYAPLASRPSMAGKQKVPLYSLGTDTAKDSILFSSLQITDAGPSYIHFPHTMNDTDVMELTAERRETRYHKGEKRLEYKQIRDRNEELDLHVYNLCAYAILDPNMDAIRARAFPEESPPQPQTQPRMTQRLRPMRRKTNWITDI